MLKTYRRHVKGCRYFSGKSTNGNRNKNNCRCPVHVDGFLNGERINHSLKIRDWTRANEIIRDWEIAGSVQEAARTDATVAQACADFRADLVAQHLSEASLKKYGVLLTNRRLPENRDKHSPSLTEFCTENGIQFVSQLTLPVLTRFRGEWKDGAIAGGKKLERLRSFGRFLTDRGWWKENLAKKLKRPHATDGPTMPFTRDEVSALLAACARFTDWHGEADQENARRLRVFILFLRYSGLRIGDAASCPIDRLVGNRLFVNTQKTRVQVFIPLPPFVVEALESCPRKSNKYWFWTGIGTKETLTGNWRRAFRRLCEIAGIKDGHPHRFRDTMAVELLLAGTPIERISVLLGHSSVKVTQRHYAPWIQERQAQAEADVARAWRDDPIAQAEGLRRDTGSNEGASQRMAATYSRHGFGGLAN